MNELRISMSRVSCLDDDLIKFCKSESEIQGFAFDLLFSCHDFVTACHDFVVFGIHFV